MILTFCVMYTTLINFFPFIDVYSRWITTVHGKKKIIQMCNGNPKGIKFQFHHRQTLLKEWHEN